MTINIAALLFIITVPTLTILSLIKKDKQVELLKEIGKKTTGTLVNIIKLKQKPKGKKLNILYVADFEYYCQGHKYTLRDMSYEFVGNHGDIENELGREVEIAYLEYKPKIARTLYDLDEPSTKKMEIALILIVSVPLLIGILLSIVL